MSPCSESSGVVTWAAPAHSRAVQLRGRRATNTVLGHCSTGSTTHLLVLIHLKGVVESEVQEQGNQGIKNNKKKRLGVIKKEKYFFMPAILSFYFLLLCISFFFCLCHNHYAYNLLFNQFITGRTMTEFNKILVATSPGKQSSGQSLTMWLVLLYLHQHPAHLHKHFCEHIKRKSKTNSPFTVVLLSQKVEYFSPHNFYRVFQ